MSEGFAVVPVVPLAHLPPPGSPAFMVIWQALQQFVDNSDEVIEAIHEHDKHTIDTFPSLPAEIETAQGLIDLMTAAFVQATDKLPPPTTPPPAAPTA